MNEAEPSSERHIRRGLGKWQIERVAAGIAFAFVVGCGNGGTEVTAATDLKSPTETSAGAQIDGEMYAAVDEERRIWFVTHVERDGGWQSGSFWRPMSPNDMTQITLFGLPNKTAQPTGKGDVMISLMVSGTSGSPKVISAKITYFSDGHAKPWTSEEGGSATVVLNRYEFDGEYLDLGGGFSGIVELHDLGNAATEVDEPRRVEISDGSFAVRLRQFQK